MAEAMRFALGNQLDIEQILLEAQHRWLRPAEICEILRNHHRFRIAPEPANMPPSGSLFLFDRKVLRYFRKDGHSWRKKKDGKTVKEAHEKLKTGSIDVLHCYYAHGEENENFQRRSYWMLEEEYTHIVLVHYREVKGSRTNYPHIREVATPTSQGTEANTPTSEIDSSVSSQFHANNNHIPSQTTDTTSLQSGQVSEYEDAESVYNHQASSRLLQQPDRIGAQFPIPCDHAPLPNCYQENMLAGPSVDFVPAAQADKFTKRNSAGSTQKHLEFSWDDVLENSTVGIESFPLTFSSTQSHTTGLLHKEENDMLGQFFTDSYGKRQEFGNRTHFQEDWQTSVGGSSQLSEWPLDQKDHSDSAFNLTTRFHEQDGSCVDLLNFLDPSHANTENNLSFDGKSNYVSTIKRHLLDGSSTEGLKKLDSFNQWMSKELEDVDDSHTRSSPGAYWDPVGSENEIDDSGILPQVRLDTYTLGPSLSQDQLFSIIDFSPNWAYSGSEIKVLITGKFLKNQQEAEQCKWSCMFGEVEVPSEILADGVLRCHTPMLKAGRVPFYVTCSNRLACSEVREFEYRNNHVQDVDDAYYNGSESDILHMRLGKLLSLSSVHPPQSDPSSQSEYAQLCSKISSMMKEDNDDWDQMLMLTSEEGFSSHKVKEQLLQKLLKEKLHTWLLRKVAEGGKGPSILDEGGQGVLHFAAALGYDWAIPPTIVAGVSVNFRDVNGWTAFHWAAFCGKERTVASLVNLDAAPGALTDPTPQYPDGRTPADLASSNGHKGIAGYLAEYSLSHHLSSLNLDKSEGSNAESCGAKAGAKAVKTASERSATPVNDGDMPYGLSLKDSLAAVCNATQAAARIHQVFRVQSFQKKQLKEYDDDKFGISDERALSLIAMKSHKPTIYNEPVNSAAIRIQNKFRSWKGRKDYLIIRQRIVKIQAHVRGHQVRKNYRNIIWSVGIMEKIILRWRRKGSGLRGFKPEALPEGPSLQVTSTKEDEYDFLKEGRKQTEVRLEKALARVKSMVQYPEARDQYRRLLNVVTEIQETKAVSDIATSSIENTDFDDDLIDLELLFDDDTQMPTAY